MRNVNFGRVAAAALVGGVAFCGLTRVALPALHAADGKAALGTAKLGNAIPNFSLPNAATGKTVDFESLSSGKKATVVIFMSTHCPVSNAYEQRIEKAAAKYASQGIQVIGVFPDVGEESEQVADHAKQKGLSFPCLRDASDKVTDEFGASCTPEVYVSDSKGVLVYHGPVDDSQNESQVTKTYLVNTLDAVLAGKPAPIQFKRAFGCQIHRP